MQRLGIGVLLLLCVGLVFDVRSTYLLTQRIQYLERELGRLRSAVDPAHAQWILTQP